MVCSEFKILVVFLSFLVCSEISGIDFRVYKNKILSLFVTMSRIDEIIELENCMEFYFQDLEYDMSFTEEQIRDFNYTWHRLNQLDPQERPPRKKRLIYSLLCFTILCLSCITIAIISWIPQHYVQGYDQWSPRIQI